MIRTHTQQQLAELLRRGEEVFERDVRSKIADADPQSYLLIDINTGDFEIDADSDIASGRLRERQPEALIYFRRVGSETVHRFGILSDPETEL